MSLREQLLKAGLVSAEEVKKLETETRKKKHQTKKNKTLAKAEVQRKTQADQQRQREQQRKREYDRQLNEQRSKKNRRKEELARIRQLITSNRVNDERADIRYNFNAGRFIRSIAVTSTQRKQLAAGKLGIVRNPQDEFDFTLLPRSSTEKVKEIDEKLVLLLYDEGVADDDDEWGDW